MPDIAEAPKPAHAAPYPAAADTMILRDPQPSLAPWFHTVGIVLLLLTYAFVAHLTHRSSSGPDASHAVQGVQQAARALGETPKVPLYISNIMLSWMLLACVIAGLYHRRAFFTTELRRRFKSRWADPAIGVGIYFGFFLSMGLLVTIFTGVLLFRAHMQRAAGVTFSPEEIQQVRDQVEHMLHIKREAVASLAPHTIPQVVLWVLLSFTAGFCEEHIFRGYLLGQTLSALRRFSMPRWLSAGLAVLATSALFGSLHLYEGVGGAVIVGVLGAVFAIAALAIGNLRAVIVAHFLQDFIGGLIYYIAHVRHAL